LQFADFSIVVQSGSIGLGKISKLAISKLHSLADVRALLVEDEPRLASGLRRLLARAGIRVTVVRTAEEAGTMLQRRAEWDLVLLDQKLPDGDGLQVLDRMEQLLPRPALVAISAHLQDSKRSLRLQGYPGVLLPKPFDRNDLLGAVADALALSARERRDSEHPESRETRVSGEQSAVLRFGPISAYLVSQTVTIDGEPVDLQPAQFRILAHMLSNPGRSLTAGELAESALRGTHADGASNVRFQIHALRRRLRAAGKLIERSDGGYGVGLGTSPLARDSH
jgi:two-component system KDP operon response regulator KdpE